jgi:hypothetical protein
MEIETYKQTRFDSPVDLTCNVTLKQHEWTQFNITLVYPNEEHLNVFARFQGSTLQIDILSLLPRKKHNDIVCVRYGSVSKSVAIASHLKRITFTDVEPGHHFSFF